MNTASIMLTTYNRLSLTKRMLDNFFRVTTSPYNLIIVDNGSTDGTPEYLKNLQYKNISNCLSFVPIFNEQNKGIASGRNQGLKQAITNNNEWLATLDNDVELPENWLSDCIDVMRVNPKFTIGVNLEDISYPLMTQNGKTFQYKARGNLGSACMVFNKNLHDKIGYFYGYGGLYATEDADWGMRSRLAGYNTGYLSENGIHFGAGDADTGEYRKWKTSCHAKNLAPFQQRCRDYMSGKIPIFYPFNEKQ